MSVVDKGYSWVIPVAFCFIQAVLFGMYRSYSLMFTELIKTFKISRSEASWPFSLCMTVIHLTGPVSGCLNKYYSTRCITFIGCLFASLGVGLSFFATKSILMVTLGVGVIQGFGIGLTHVQNNAIINQYFEKYRGVASGISLSGGTLGAFFLSFLLDYSLRNLPMQTSFLLLSCISLTTLPVSLLLKPFKRHEECKNNSQVAVVSSPSLNNVNYCHSGQCIIYREHSLFNVNLSSAVNLRSYNPLEPPVKTGEGKCKSQAAFPLFLATQSPLNISDKNDKSTCDSHFSSRFTCKKCVDPHVTQGNTCDPVKSCLHNDDPDAVEVTSYAETDNIENDKTIDIIKGILCHRLFHLIALTHMSYFWGSITYTMVIVDFALDKNIQMPQSVMIINAFSIGDLCGRLGSGILLDRGVISLKTTTMISIFGLGCLLLSNLISCSLSCLLLISCLMGLLSGVINILLNLLFCHYIGSDKAALAFGLSSFLSGIATLARPLVVGYFRDSPTNGSYNGLLMSLGVFCVCTGFLWFLEPLLMRKQNEPKNASVMTLATSTSSLATTTESTLRLKESIDDNRTCIHRQL